MKKSLLTVFTLFTLALQCQVNLTQSLVACYPLNGNATDLHANSLSGTLYNGTTVSDRNNIPASALEFAGNDTSFIELPNSPLLKSVNAVSFSGWVYFHAFLADDHLVFTKNNSSSSFAAYSLISYNSGGYHFRTYKENGIPNFAQSTTTIALNTWYHVAFTIDNNFLKIYVNGVMENSTPSTADFDYDVNGKTVILGGTNESNYNTPFNGKMDNVRFYNRVLNAAEVLALYQQDPACVGETVGIDEQSEALNYSLYPNPGNDVLNLDLKANISSKAYIYSSSGELVKDYPVAEGKNILSIHGLPSGIYILVLDGVNQSKTFIKN